MLIIIIITIIIIMIIIIIIYLFFATELAHLSKNVEMAKPQLKSRGRF